MFCLIGIKFLPAVFLAMQLRMKAPREEGCHFENGNGKRHSAVLLLFKKTEEKARGNIAAFRKELSEDGLFDGESAKNDKNGVCISSAVSRDHKSGDLVHKLWCNALCGKRSEWGLCMGEPIMKVSGELLELLWGKGEGKKE